MGKARLARLPALLLLCLLGAAPAERGDLWKPPSTQPDPDAPENVPKAVRLPGIRHWHYMLHGVPAPYAGARSSVERTDPVIAGGGRIYRDRCASCHGPTGFGVAEGNAQSLLPSPALLSFLVQKPIAVDEYLLWSISEGGIPFDTAMPAFKDVLTRQQIWDVIAYMRAGFPEPGK